MGSSTSKPETKVLIPSAPVEFGSSFLSQLENSKESNYSRAQYSEKYIQDRVTKQLTELELKASKQLQKSLDNSSLEQEPALIVEGPNEKIAKLSQSLQKAVKDAEVHISKEIQDARESVLGCLKSNTGKPLNCWDEVKAFEQLVKAL